MKKLLFCLLIFLAQNIGFSKYIALTFDDWPNNIYTPQVLEILKKENIKATFFVLGKNSQTFSGILQQEFNEWHEIWNHSYSHPNFNKIGDEKAIQEIEKTNKIIENIIWKKPKFYRPPYWLRNENIVKHFSGQRLAMRNIEAMDRKLKTSNDIKNQIVKNVKDDGIILIHDLHNQSVQALENIITTLKSQGYEFVTLSQLQKQFPDSLDPSNAKYIPDIEKKFVQLPNWFRKIYLNL